METSIEPHEVPRLVATATRRSERRERRPAGVFGRTVARLDALLRRRLGVYEFSDHPACLLRVAIVPAHEDVVLADGTRIGRGEPLADLHLWNERLPPIPPQGASLAWATEVRRRLQLSLGELARHLEAHPELHEVKAVRADTLWMTRTGRMNVAYLGTRFGFERLEPRSRRRLFRLIHNLGANLLLWALIGAFNRHAFRGKRLAPLRGEYWMSRRSLLGRYGRTVSVDGAPWWAREGAAE